MPCHEVSSHGESPSRSPSRHTSLRGGKQKDGCQRHAVEDAGAVPQLGLLFPYRSREASRYQIEIVLASAYMWAGSIAAQRWTCERVEEERSFVSIFRLPSAGPLGAFGCRSFGCGILEVLLPRHSRLQPFSTIVSSSTTHSR